MFGFEAAVFRVKRVVLTLTRDLTFNAFLADGMKRVYYTYKDISFEENASKS